jgi:hypothetical protein
VSGGSDEERFPPVAHRIATPVHHDSATWSPDWSQRLPVPCTFETPKATQTQSAQPSPGRRGFLKGVRTRPRSRTVAGQFLIVFFRTQKDEVPALGTLSQVRQSDVVVEPFAGAVAGSPFRTERRCRASSPTKGN